MTSFAIYLQQVPAVVARRHVSSTLARATYVVQPPGNIYYKDLHT